MRKIKIFLFICVFASGTGAFYAGAARISASSIDSAGLLEKINRERANRHIPILAISPKLNAAAEAKTLDMINRQYFSHVDPDGKYVWPKIEAAGYRPYRTLGENLAIDFSTEEGVIKAWIDSPSHRENLLRSDFEDQGLSAQYGDFQGRYTSLVASLFGALAKPQAKTKPPSAPSAPQPRASSPPAASSANPPQPQNNTPADSGHPAKSEPAVLLSYPDSATDGATASSGASSIIRVGAITAPESNLYAVLRAVFLMLAIALCATFAADAFRSEKISRLLRRNGNFTLVLLIVLVSLLSWTMY